MSLNPIHITPYSFCSIGAITARTAANALTAASSTALATNQAYFYPFFLEEPFVIQNAFTVNGATATGNVDIGVYTPDGTRLCNVGATAMSGTNALQTYTLSYTLGPGNYLLAIGSSSTGTVFATGPAATRNIPAGVLTQAGGYSSGLVASATFANGSNQNAYVFGISRRSFI